MDDGYFITFEGGEGVGKTTQIQKLADFLKLQKYDVITTREPGGTDAAEEIRNLLSHKKFGGHWTAEAELLLLFAARAMHIKNVIAPALQSGKVVLCDRYIDSTRIYQGYLQAIDMDFIYNLETRIVGNFIPNLTFLLDIPAEIAMQRVKKRGEGDHYDQGDFQFYSDLRNGFIDLAKNNSDRFCVIDANNEIENIAQKIKDIVIEKLPHAF